MSSIHRLLSSLLILITLSTSALLAQSSPPPSPAAKFAPRTIDWTELMPEEDLQLLMTMPQAGHENLTDEELMQEMESGTLRSPSPTKPKNNPGINSLEDEVANAIGLAMQPNTKERTWQDALVSTRVRPEFDNTQVRIAGYIVPLDFDDHEVITSFFLVPYFGACIHVPPPPPNQIIYIRYPKGLKLDNLYTPFWVTGTLKIETVENDMGLSSYSMTADKLVQYQEDELVD